METQAEARCNLLFCRATLFDRASLVFSISFRHSAASNRVFVRAFICFLSYVFCVVVSHARFKCFFYFRVCLLLLTWLFFLLLLRALWSGAAAARIIHEIEAASFFIFFISWHFFHFIV